MSLAIVSVFASEAKPSIIANVREDCHAALGVAGRTTLGVTPRQENRPRASHEVAEVVRRCFVRSDGSIVRKGQVITYQDVYQGG